MANLKNAADNGALITLGLVGVVAVAGAVAKRGVGSMARIKTAPQLAEALNDNSFAFYPADRGLLVDDDHHFSIRVVKGMAEVEKRLVDRRGFLQGMRSLGDFRVDDVDGIVRALRSDRFQHGRGSGSMARGDGSMSRVEWKLIDYMISIPNPSKPDRFTVSMEPVGSSIYLSENPTREEVVSKLGAYGTPDRMVVKNTADGVIDIDYKTAARSRKVRPFMRLERNG